MFGLFPTTPRYHGNAQPSSNRDVGVFGLVSGLFATATPSYATADAKPSTNAGPILGPSAPTGYTNEHTMPAPCASSVEAGQAPHDPLATQPACSVPLPVAIVIQRSPQ